MPTCVSIIYPTSGHFQQTSAIPRRAHELHYVQCSSINKYYFHISIITWLPLLTVVLTKTTLITMSIKMTKVISLYKITTTPLRFSLASPKLSSTSLPSLNSQPPAFLNYWLLLDYVLTLYIFFSMCKFCSFKPLNYVLSLPSCFLFSHYVLQNFKCLPFATELCYDSVHLLKVQMPPNCFVFYHHVFYFHIMFSNF